MFVNSNILLNLIVYQMWRNSWHLWLSRLCHKITRSWKSTSIFETGLRVSSREGHIHTDWLRKRTRNFNSDVCRAKVTLDFLWTLFLAISLSQLLSEWCSEHCTIYYFLQNLQFLFNSVLGCMEMFSLIGLFKMMTSLLCVKKSQQLFGRVLERVVLSLQ